MECLESQISQKTLYQSSTSTLAETWEDADIKCRKIKIFPSKTQKIQFKKWIGTCRYVYNQALNGIKNNSEPINFYSLRNKYVIAKNNELVTDWQKETPKDVRAGAMNDLYKAYNTCFSQLKTGLITNFNVGFRTKKKETSLEIGIAHV